jgi:hypothetical protein
MLREIIESAIGGAPDMSVVDSPVRGGSYEPTETSFDDVEADVLIVQDGRATAELESFLYRHPSMQLIAIDDDGRFTSLYELRPHHVALGNLSPQGLVDTIRGAVYANRGRR